MLGLERNPWLEPDALKRHFLERSAPLHPDRAHASTATDVTAASHAFADLNAAYLRLRDPRDRILHLLELETGSRPANTQAIPSAFFTLYSEVGQLCHGLDRFLAERSAAQSPMLRAELFGRSLDWTDQLQSMQGRLQPLRHAAEEELKSIGAAWPLNRPLTRLAELAHTFACLQRWEAQINERLAQLAV